LPPIQTVFVIVMENLDWSAFKGSTDAPYINNALLPTGSYCEQYYNPPGLHPSLPNYLWLEAGTNFGIYSTLTPATAHQATTNHLSALLTRVGVSWRAYQEDISGTYVPLDNTNLYAVRHDPFVYFDDVSGTNNSNWAFGIAHIRPYEELAADLTNNTVARYNFITPNLCHDGHDTCSPLDNPVGQIDSWLAGAVPAILQSAAYTNGGALFITWDEGAAPSDGPIGMIVLSPHAKGGGYSNSIHYTHSSFLRTLQEIFGVMPLLGDAVNAPDLGDLFARYAVSEACWVPNGGFQLTVAGAMPGRTNVVQVSTNLREWSGLCTNICATNAFSVLDPAASAFGRRYYRAVQLP
jgi:hypothetical protein